MGLQGLCLLREVGEPGVVQGIAHGLVPIPAGVDHGLVERGPVLVHLLAIELLLGGLHVVAELFGEAVQLTLVPFHEILGALVLLEDVAVTVVLQKLLEAIEVLELDPGSQLGTGDVLGLHRAHVHLGLVVGVRDHRGRDDARDGHQAAQDDAVGHALTTEADLLAVLLAGEDRDQDGPDHRRILLVIDVLEPGVVAVRGQDHLGHVVGAQGEAVHLLEELLAEDGVGRNLGHEDELEPVLAGLKIVHLLQVTLHAAGFFQSAHEGQHEAEVLAAEDAPGQLEGFQFPVVDVAGHAPVAEHGVVLVILEQGTAQEVAVLVGLEVRGPVDDVLAVEGHGEQGQALGQGLDVVFLAGAETARVQKLLDPVGERAGLVHLGLKAHLQGHFLAQGADAVQHFENLGIVLDPGHVGLHVALVVLAQLERLGIIERSGLQQIEVPKDHGQVGSQVHGGLQAVQALGGVLDAFVEALLQFTHAAMLGQNLVGAPGTGSLGQGLHLAGQACEPSHVGPQREMHGDQAGGQLVLHHLGQVRIQLLELLLHEPVQGAVVVGLQGQRMDADVAEHELGAQQSHLEVRHIAQPREEQGLAHVGQNQADLGLGGRQLAHVDLAAHLDEREHAPVDPTPRAVHRDLAAVQGAQGLHPLDADDRRDAQFAGGDGRVARVAAHVGQNGRGDAHARNHVRVGAVGGQDVALVDLVQLQGRTQEAHRALPRAAGGAVALDNDLGVRHMLGLHLAAAHENRMGVVLQLLVPAGLRPGLYEPETIRGVDAELGVHDDPAVGLGDGPHAARHLFRLGQGQGPAVDEVLIHLD